MEHRNPLLPDVTSQKFITFGEIMLRLTPPNYEKIRVATSFEASYGGSEANIALALANLGIDSTFFSVVPNNSLGKSAVRMLRSNDVHCTPVILSTPEETPTHRLGTYYLETGYRIRPSKVTYDRKHSAITEYDFSKVDLDALLAGFNWLHLSGITPALSPSCADFILACIKKAKESPPPTRSMISRPLYSLDCQISPSAQQMAFQSLTVAVFTVLRVVATTLKLG